MSNKIIYKPALNTADEQIRAFLQLNDDELSLFKQRCRMLVTQLKNNFEDRWSETHHIPAILIPDDLVGMSLSDMSAEIDLINKLRNRV